MSNARLIVRLFATTALAGAWTPPGAFAQSLDEPANEPSDEAPITTPKDSIAPEHLPEPDASDEIELSVGPRPPASSIINEEEEQVLFEADTVTRENEFSPILAEGNVRAYFGDRYLRADRLSYDPETDLVVAEGNVSITDATLETAFAGRVELTGDLRDGVAENFSALLAENARLAAETAVREQGARTRLTKAVYTSCEVCKDDGEAKTPTWRIKALRVTRDEERRVVRFHHAFFELKGVPILYAPFIQAPDPSVERQSGFLTPLIGASSRLGFNIEMPYYLALSHHHDATFFPKYTSNDGVLWQGEYRRRDESGYNVLSGGIIDFDNTAPGATGAPGVRWHVFAQGHRNLGDNLRLGYDVERVSDNTYLRRYNVQRRGDLRKELDTSSTNRLRSNVYSRWKSGGTEISADAYLFQGLRSSDRSELTPYVLPLIDVRHDFDRKFAGGRTTLNVNLASLQRKAGVDTRRFTASAYWEREHITPGGHRLKGFAELRGDAFYYQDLDEGTEIRPGTPGDTTQFDARFSPSVGAEWSYPLTRRAGNARLFVEPRVQLVASPANRNSAALVNEDSQSIEFDYAGLFEYNKSTGFDAFEDGQRMNAGVAASIVFDNGIEVEGEFGAQFRLQDTMAFQTSTGLGEKRSDFVGAVNLKFRNNFGISNRFRIDDDTGAIQRAESMAYLNLWRLTGNVTYVRLNEENVSAALVRREELNARMNFRLTDHWSTGFGWREDLLANTTITQDFVLKYSDDCSLLELIYRRDRTTDVGLEADDAFLVRFTLRSLVD